MNYWKLANERGKIVIDNSTIGQRILTRRRGLHISQHTLAKMVGVSSSAISLWESDKTVPRGENLHTLAVAMQCSAEWVLYGDVYSPPPQSPTPTPLTNDETEILSLFRTLPLSEQKTEIQSLREKSQYFRKLFKELKAANKRIAKNKF